MINGFFGLPWFLWAGLALFIAVVYSFVWPSEAATENTGFRYFILRWGHALTWLLLTINFVMRGIGSDLNGGASFFALAGGVTYVLFLSMTYVVKN